MVLPLNFVLKLSQRTLKSSVGFRGQHMRTCTWKKTKTKKMESGLGHRGRLKNPKRGITLKQFLSRF
jgi:hypothetical protein